MTPRLHGCFALLIAAALCAVVAPAARAASPQLHVSMLVDQVAARPGDVVRYQVLVENLGDADAGPFRITSHYPEHTTADSQRCPNGPVEPDGSICIGVDLPTPGLGGGAHQVNHSEGGLAPGATVLLRFAVRVDADAPLGLHLGNHAHASSATAPEATSAPVDTLVVRTVPNAVFGASALTASGQAVTDSWDSSAGSLAQTRQLTDGDVASNGDISVSGGSLINGDATPGPGGSVVVTDTAQVTGSTAPAAEDVVLNEVDATAHASNNDNHRICREAGSCTDSSYDASTKTLVVNGSAALPSGAYYLCRLEVNGVLKVTGTVALWFGPPSICGGVNFPVLFQAAGSVSINSGRTRDVQLLVQGPGTVLVTSASSLTGLVHVPQGTFAVEGHGALLGNASAGSAQLSGQALVHIDRALAG